MAATNPFDLDLTTGKRDVCPVHQITMAVQLVPVDYDSPSSISADSLKRIEAEFPYYQETIPVGHLPGLSDSHNRALIKAGTVFVCPQCVAAHNRSLPQTATSGEHSNVCPDCGSPSLAYLKERGVKLAANGVFGEFSCPQCRELEQVPLSAIPTVLGTGVRVACQACKQIAWVPAAVWCKTCQRGLRPGWQNRITLL